MTPPDALSIEPAGAAPEMQQSADLPAGWIWSTLGEAAAVNPPTDLNGLPDEVEIPFVPMAAVAEETGGIDASRRRRVAEVRKGYVRFCDGDVIFAKITPCMENGKTAPVTGIGGKYAAGSTEFHVLRPAAVDPRYLWYWLVRRAFRQDAERNMSGSAGQLRVPAEYLRNAFIPVAPLAEQRRIVARIDELFAEIAEGEAALERARKDLDTWRRALLKAAVTGELTRDWREANRPTETGAELLAKIRDEAAHSRAGPRPRRSPIGETAGLPALPTLPKGWVWAQLADLGEVSGGLTKNPDREKLPEKLPFLRVANVQMGGLDLGTVNEIGVKPEERERLLLALDDLLVVEGNGSIEQIGRCALWSGQIQPCVHQNHIIKVRFTEPTLAHWALRWLLSPSGRAAIRAVASSTSGLHTLSISKVQNLSIPVPPFPEVQLALSLVGEALGATADVGIEFYRADADRVALQQSILKAAFEGRLVPQASADEPASVLLARLHERAPTPARSRTRSRRNRQTPYPSLPGLSAG
jgi:type I restriction enzyme, S subunit